MNEVKAYGRFTKEGDNIFRTSTYLQFGDSTEKIGACVMCNPGSADKNEVIKINQLEGLQRLKTDPTMNRLIEMLKEANESELHGRVYIYNLFTLKNSKMENALKTLSGIQCSKLLYQDLDDFKKEYESFPWVILAWGCGDTSKIKKEKRKWKQFIEEREILVLGKEQTEPNYYHIRPLKLSTREEVKEYLIKQYREKALNNPRFSD